MHVAYKRRKKAYSANIPTLIYRGKKMLLLANKFEYVFFKIFLFFVNKFVPDLSVYSFRHHLPEEEDCAVTQPNAQQLVL